MRTYTRRLVLPIDEVVWHINQQEKQESFYGNYSKSRVLHGFKVGLLSIRLRTFARDAGNLRCVHCGLKGSFFSIDSHRTQLSHTHLNLYGVDVKGTEILMTCDHILARGLGGKNDLSNTQVLCSPCNSIKSAQESRVSNEIRTEMNLLNFTGKIGYIVVDSSHPSLSEKAKKILTQWIQWMNLPEYYPCDKSCKRPKVATD